MAQLVCAEEGGWTVREGLSCSGMGSFRITCRMS